jgi:hypothetical protein
MARRQFAGGAARTVLSGTIPSSGGGTVVIDNATGWPDGSVGPFLVVVDPDSASFEKILVDSRVGTTLTFSVDGRGYDGTVATSHAVGATIWHSAGAIDFDEANAHINATSGAHAATAISFAPTGNIAATNVQAAIAELDTEAADARLDLIEANNWVTQARMGDGSVGTAELIDSNVTTAKIADANVTTVKILDANVTTAKIADLNVTTGKLADGAVTQAKMAVLPTSRFGGAVQAVGSAAEVSISFTSESEDDLTLAAPTFTVITMPAGSGGWWAIDVQLGIDVTLGGASGSDGALTLLKTGARYTVPLTVFPNNITAGATWTVWLVDGDTLELKVYNGAGGTRNFSSTMKMARLGIA